MKARGYGLTGRIPPCSSNPSTTKKKKKIINKKVKLKESIYRRRESYRKIQVRYGSLCSKHW
jgi:hypothetical protein